ncbi:MAG TPA: hypothetical protein VGI39_43610 [Polyangiaceae bacterium]|jgi:hypothetical protein
MQLVPSLWEIDLTRLPGPLGKVGEKELHLWVGAWLKDRARKAMARKLRPAGTRHLLFSICDHYEPLHGNADFARGMDRVNEWRMRYPEMAREFRDADGRPPRHSYFFPGEQYDGRFIEPLAEMCAAGLGEVEVHLHHDGDTRETLRTSLEQTLRDLDRHGVVPKVRGKHAWSFIHGNWCLANARRDGRWCGVDDEMDLLWELGCYCDLTFPSAPDQSQPGIVNSIYYPRGDVSRRRAYEDGEPVRVGTPRQDRLLLIEGPIALALRPGSRAPRIESAALDHGDPPTAERLQTWVDQEVTVGGRPEWVFVKLHTHGAPEKNAKVLLGDESVRFHRALRQKYNDGRDWKLHYVTAREMFNLARAAMDGKRGEPSDWFDYEVPAPPRARS